MSSPDTKTLMKDRLKSKLEIALSEDSIVPEEELADKVDGLLGSPSSPVSPVSASRKRQTSPEFTIEPMIENEKVSSIKVSTEKSHISRSVSKSGTSSYKSITVENDI